LPVRDPVSWSAQPSQFGPSGDDLRRVRDMALVDRSSILLGPRIPSASVDSPGWTACRGVPQVSYAKSATCDREELAESWQALVLSWAI
jgi:hypothetical protein